MMTDDELRKIWRTAGGSFHGPNIETGTMPESQLLPFLRSLSTTPSPISDQAAGEPVAWPYEITRDHIECLIMDHQRDGKKHLAGRLSSSGSYLIRVAESFRWCLEQIDAALSTAPTTISSDQAAGEPIPMLLFCPKCHAQHIDAKSGEHDIVHRQSGTVVDTLYDWDNPPHKSHLCHACGNIWRPADVATTGVASIKTKGKADTWGSTAPTTGSAPEQFPYQKTFDAIAAATSVCAGRVAISVIDFREAFGNAPASPAASVLTAEKPIALFQFDERWKTWAQVDPNYAADPDVIPLYRHPSAAMGVLRTLAEAAETHFSGGVAPLRRALDEAHALLAASMGGDKA